ncbi:hypothetical protein BC827DRAFT_1378456 [Russula dissimulans]|nr:hypothetical protein BC827DRAFT_1378456 [Russula dissimulans]
MAKLQEDSPSFFTIKNKTGFPAALRYNDEEIVILAPGQTSEPLDQPGTYQAWEVLPLIPPPRVLVEVVVTRPPDAVDNTYTTTRNFNILGGFLVEIEFEEPHWGPNW